MTLFNSSMGIPMTGDPTQVQIEYAQRIHDAVGAELPKQKTKQEYSEYICRWAPKYKALQKGGAS